CSTGQEAYSLAIALSEFLEDKPVRPAIQIFATDLSDTVSLSKAREGIYPENIEAEVSPERLRHFFSKEDSRYRVSKTLREMVVFAKQNVASDPPFSHLDLISCRNLLIYLALPLQKRVIPTFHYALNPAGFLVLGHSETVGAFTDLFGVVDQSHRIYVKQTTAARQYPHFHAEDHRPGAERGRMLAEPGEYRWHLSRAHAMRNAEGEVLMWIGSNTEIHEQMQMTTELRKLAAELSDADRRKNEFLAMLAHELRNPLAPIRNALEVLRLKARRRNRQRSEDEAVRSACSMMERQLGQMVRLVDDLLDVSRISRGKIELRRERSELASAVHHAVEAARPLCERMDHEMTVTLPPEPVYLNADPIRLTQVVGNLLNNAGKFTERGGRIGVTVEREDGEAVVRVRDTGIGITAEELPRIFEMFTQLDTSLERSRSGLGIGLALAKNLVELHGGTVEVHSAGLGQGSEFRVRLPIVVETPELPPEPTARAPTPMTARRILVVDDNRDSAESLTMLLNLTGYETHTAYDGLDAVEAAATFRPDVILLDIGLPKLNGFEAARKIREQQSDKSLVLVALTG
ncbi:MAG: CheR family methyltransferase, partial [Gammaproteobacteria bacterium]